MTLTECEYYVGDGLVPPGRTRTSAADFRHLTPIVVRAALERAGTSVCEPMMQARIESPTTSVRGVVALVLREGGRIEEQVIDGATSELVAVLPASRSQVVLRALHGATGGEGLYEAHLAGHRPVQGPAPVRAA